MTYAGDERTPADLTTTAPDTGCGGSPLESNKLESTPSKKIKTDRTQTCAASGEVLDADRMIRLVIGPDGVLYPDFAENLPGTAFWCNLYRPVLERALTDNPFGDAIIPPDMMDRIEKGLRAQAMGMISMARKSGAMFTGAEKTEQLLRDGRAGIYLTASPRDADTRMKLTALAGDRCRIVDLFTSAELSTATGANKVFHAAMLPGGTAKYFFTHVKRLNLTKPQTTEKPNRKD